MQLDDRTAARRELDPLRHRVAADTRVARGLLERSRAWLGAQVTSREEHQ